MSEERYPDLNEEVDFVMEDSREEHWRSASEDGDDKEKMHALRREVYK